MVASDIFNSSDICARVILSLLLISFNISLCLGVRTLDFWGLFWGSFWMNAGWIGNVAIKIVCENSCLKTR